MSPKKYVYFFGNGKADGAAEMKNLLGGKGANLAEMTNLKIPVPAGFTVTTEVCTYYYENGKKYPKELEAQVKEALAKIEKAMGAKFNDTKNPLLLSVRSGARVSMPGMMDTVLNLGLNDTTVQALIKASGNERFGWDSYRRFIQMYTNVVMGLDGEHLEADLEALKKAKKVELDTDLTAADLKQLVETFKKTVKKHLKKSFPEDPKEQLWGGIGAVFSSWMVPRAITYRKLNNIPEDWGTAVNVQAMVFGNMGDDCATGVAFTRDPSTGENVFFGEFLVNAQGEDVVAGIRTPQPINKAGKEKGSKVKSLEEAMPVCYKELVAIYKRLEKHYRDMQDIEFTIQNNKLWMLQTRNGKRTAAAAIKTAVDMVGEKLITKEEAVMRVKPEQLDQLLHPMLDPKAKKVVLAKGLPASPGAANGKVVFTADDAELQAGKGEKVILVRHETSPEDIHGMHAAQAILTAKGGMTSHAAVVARGMGKCCVAGCGAVNIDYKAKQFTVGNTVVKEGDIVTLNGSSGELFLGKVPTIQPTLDKNFATLMGWADTFRKINVRTNADTPDDAKTARDFGAEGIGLTRTEHMFFDEKRIANMREMILADDVPAREKALAKLLPYQKEDFIGIFKAMNGLPVTIRLLDPPLHEFLPQDDNKIVDLSKQMNVPKAKLEAKIKSLHELNPMLGHRGCRLGIIYPEITKMQARAILEAAAELKQKKVKVLPEIMIPLIGTAAEFNHQKALVDEVAKEVKAKYKIKELDYMVGTMIEIPRAALTADKIAKTAEFFSFGTNDLTQMAFGYSRDDAGTFLPAYVEMKILAEDPFQVLDQEGVGQLVQLGIERGRSTNPKLKVGICGEHGGEPKSVEFCAQVGMNYVSCSPYRVPIARLAAAHAAIKEAKAQKSVKKVVAKVAAKKAVAKKVVAPKGKK